MNAYVLIGHVDPVDDLLSCQQFLRDRNWWAAAGLPEQWPLTSEDAAALLREGGQYAIDQEQLEDLVQRGLLPRPPADGDQLEWSVVEVLQAASLLEARRQWRPFPSAHDPKKDNCQLLLEQARAENDVPMILNLPGQPRWDLRHLLELLAASDSRDGRRKILAILKAHLEVEYEVFLP